MALDVRTGVHALRTTTGNGSLTGVTAPTGGWKALIAFCLSTVTANGIFAEAQPGIGIATAAAQDAGMSIVIRDAQTSSDTVARRTGTRFMHQSEIASAATPTIELDFVSFNSDGFTYNVVVNTNARALALHYFLLGGDTITNIRAFTFNTGTATGALSVTTPGFTPTWAIFMTPQMATASTSVAGATWAMGLAANVFGTTKQYYSSISSSDNVAAGGQGTSVQRSGICVGATNKSTAGAVDGEASLTGWTATGFDLNITDAFAADTTILCLCGAGGYADIGAATFPTSVTSKRVGTAVIPKGAFFFGRSLPSASTINTAGDRFFVGAADSAGNENSIGWHDSEPADPTVVKQFSSDSKAIEKITVPSTVAQDADVTLNNDGTFTVSATTADGNADEFLYMVWGEQPAPRVPKLLPIIPEVAVRQSFFYRATFPDYSVGGSISPCRRFGSNTQSPRGPEECAMRATARLKRRSFRQQSTWRWARQFCALSKARSMPTSSMTELRMSTRSRTFRRRIAGVRLRSFVR